MKYMKFSQFVALKEDAMGMASQTQQANQAKNRANEMQMGTPSSANKTVSVLQQASKAPTPPGANPAVVKQNMNQAIQFAKQFGATDPAAAVNAVKAQKAASTNQ